MRGLLAVGPKNSPAEAGEASEIVSVLKCCCSAVVGVVVRIVPVVIISPKPPREIVVAILFGTTATLSGNSPSLGTCRRSTPQRSVQQDKAAGPGNSSTQQEAIIKGRVDLQPRTTVYSSRIINPASGLS